MSGYYRLTRGIKILMVEDSPSDAGLIEAHLKKASSHFELTYVESLAAARKQLKQDRFDIILLDLHLPDSYGLDTLHKMRLDASSVPIVILSGQEDEELAVDAVSQGAQDYLPKNKIDADYLARSLRYAIERFRRQQAENELRFAGAIQRRLLPRAAPEVPGLDLCGRCYPAKWIGGDYFDFFHMPDGVVAIVLGDVCGHGMGAALFMTEVRAVVRALAMSQLTDNPGEILSMVNEVLTEDLEGDSFVALHVASLDPRTGVLRYASAGHPGYVLDRAGDVRIVQSDDPPIGVVQHCDFASRTEILECGDVLALYTDGFTESCNALDEPFGDERVFDILRNCRHQGACKIIDSLFDAARSFTNNVPHYDDMTAAILKLTGPA